MRGGSYIYYTYFSQAMTAVANSETIEVLKDVASSYAGTTISGKSITIKAVKKNENDTATSATINLSGEIVVSTGATLTIGGGEDKILIFKPSSTDVNAFNNKGTLTIENGEFDGFSSTYGSVVRNGGINATLTINGGTFKNNKSVIYNQAKVIINDGLFTGNSTPYNGGVIMNGGDGIDATLEINGGTYKSNSAGNGGVIYNSEVGEVSITGGIFGGDSVNDGNSGYYSGGAIENHGSLSMVSGEGKQIRFKNNSSSEDGQDIYSLNLINVGGDIVIPEVFFTTGGDWWGLSVKKQMASSSSISSYIDGVHELLDTTFVGFGTGSSTAFPLKYFKIINTSYALYEDGEEDVLSIGYAHFLNENLNLKFESIKDAVKYLQTNDVLLLIKDYHSGEGIFIENKTFTLKANTEKTLFLKYPILFSGSNITLGGGEALLKISPLYNADTAAFIIPRYYAGGNLTINDNTEFSGFDRKGQSFGGAISMSSGTLTINGGTFKNNKVSYVGGGAISLGGGSSAVLRLNGGFFENNQAPTRGGAIEIESGVDVEITGGIFSGNTATNGKDIYTKEDIKIGGNANGFEVYLDNDKKINVQSSLATDAEIFISTTTFNNIDKEVVSYNAGVTVPTYVLNNFTYNPALFALYEKTTTTLAIGALGGTVGEPYSQSQRKYVHLNDAVRYNTGTFLIYANTHTITKQVLINGNRNVSISSTATITRGASFNESMFVISSGSSLTIYDYSSGAAPGGIYVTIDGGSRSIGNVNGAVFHNSGTLIIKAAQTFKNNITTGKGAVIYNTATGTVDTTQSDSSQSYPKFQGNKAANGGVIYALAGNLSLRGTFNNNEATTNGGVIFNEEANVTITSGTFSNNKAVKGGVLYLYQISQNIIQGGNYYSNTAVAGTGSNGSVVYAGRDGYGNQVANNIVISNSSFMSNTGGATLFSDFNMTVRNSTLTNNSCGNYSAIYMNSTTFNGLISTTLTMSGIMRFASNSGPGGYADIYLKKGSSTPIRGAKVYVDASITPQDGSGASRPISIGSGPTRTANYVIASYATGVTMQLTHWYFLSGTLLKSGSNYVWQ